MSDPKRPTEQVCTEEPVRTERRRFLQVGATASMAGAAAAVAGGASCAGLGSLSMAGKLLKQQPLSDSEMNQYLGVMDRGMQGIATRSLAADLVPGEFRNKKWLATLGAESAVTRKALRALYFSAMVNDLPAQNHSHPELQKRLAQVTPELDDAVFTMTGALKSLTKEDQRQVQHHLKKHPDTGMQICEIFESQARSLGLPLSRRLQTRAMVSNLSWRLRSQPPSLLIDEYVGKVQKVAAASGQAEQLKRYFAHATGSAAFWSHQRRLAALTTPPVHGLKKAEAPSPLEKEKKKKSGPGQPIVNAGLVLLGLAGGAGAAGGALAAAAQIAGAFVLTAAAVLLLSGLIVIIVGAVKNARAK